MSLLMSLWLPILLSAVFVFIASSLIHMVIKWHAPHYKSFSNEDEVRAAINNGNPGPGKYVLPYCADMKEMASDTMKKKYEDGPIGFVYLGNKGLPNMGKFLSMWFIFCVLVSAASGFLSAQAMGFDQTHFHLAIHHIAIISFIGYGFGVFPEIIWKYETWGAAFKFLLDALVYAAITAATFYWLWPLP